MLNVMDVAELFDYTVSLHVLYFDSECSRHLEVARRTCGSNFRPNSKTCSMIHCHELLPRNGSPNRAKSCKIHQNPNPMCIERADCLHQTEVSPQGVTPDEAIQAALSACELDGTEDW